MLSLTVFMYHDVRSRKDTKFPTRYLQPSFLEPDVFRKQIDFINRNYCVISTADIPQIWHYQKDAHFAVLTFDDGLIDHYNVVAPILHDLELKASFFLPVLPIQQRKVMDTHKIQFILSEAAHEQHIVNDILFYFPYWEREYIFDTYSKSLWKDNYWSKERVFVTRFLRDYKDVNLRQTICSNLFCKYVTHFEKEFAAEFYLSEKQVQEMARSNLITLGGHGYHSENLLNYSLEGRRTEARLTANYLSDEFGIKHKYFSYPNGGVDDGTTAIMKTLGYEVCFGTRNDIVVFPLAHSILNIPRIDAPQKIKL